jgi:hypothetical protein
VEVITMEYCNLPICCRYCSAMDHLVKNCIMMLGNQRDAMVKGCGVGIPQLAGPELGSQAPEVVLEQGGARAARARNLGRDSVNSPGETNRCKRHSLPKAKKSPKMQLIGQSKSEGEGHLSRRKNECFLPCLQSRKSFHLRLGTC